MAQHVTHKSHMYGNGADHRTNEPILCTIAQVNVAYLLIYSKKGTICTVHQAQSGEWGKGRLGLEDWRYDGEILRLN